jgi:hypothetical protein
MAVFFPPQDTARNAITSVRTRSTLENSGLSKRNE